VLLSYLRVDLLATHAFNHFTIDFHQFERDIEIWDPAGKASHASFWSTFYQNVYFHVVIYVINATEVRTAHAETGIAHHPHTALCVLTAALLHRHLSASFPRSTILSCRR
jgi:hypothetical protein